jgi:hypothetical protein
MIRLGPWVIGALLMTAVLVNASDYSFLVPQREMRLAAHHDVVTHSAPAPARYRLLVPLALDLPIRAFASRMPYDKAFGRVYAVFYFVALTSVLAVLVYELSLWFTLEQALVGTLLVGSTIRMALRQGEYVDLASIPASGIFAPHSLLEPIFVALAIVLAVRDRRWWLGALIVPAMLNSEAGALLPLVYVAVRGVSALSLKTTAAYMAVGLATSIGIRLVVGVSSSPGTGTELLHENLSHLAVSAINIALFLGPLWLLAGLGLKHAPAPIRRAAWLIPVYLGGVAFAGLWWDVRLLMGLYPLLMPLILSALFLPRATAAATA